MELGTRKAVRNLWLLIGGLGLTVVGVVGTVNQAHGATPAPQTTTSSAQREVIRDHPVLHGAVAEATGRACKQEDSVNCFWNAKKQGNGVGHSHYNIAFGAEGKGSVCVIYWNKRYDRNHGYCA